jgi:hypothetical protein
VEKCAGRGSRSSFITTLDVGCICAGHMPYASADAAKLAAMQ